MTLDRMLATAALLEQDGSFQHKKLPDAAGQVSRLLQDFYTDGADQRMSVADYARYWLSSGRGNLPLEPEKPERSARDVANYASVVLDDARSTLKCAVARRDGPARDKMLQDGIDLLDSLRGEMGAV